MAGSSITGKTLLYRGILKSCNYHCSYCPFSKHPMTARELKKDRDQWFSFVQTFTEKSLPLNIRAFAGSLWGGLDSSLVLGGTEPYQRMSPYRCRRGTDQSEFSHTQIPVTLWPVRGEPGKAASLGYFPSRDDHGRDFRQKMRRTVRSRHHFVCGSCRRTGKYRRKFIYEKI